MKNEQFIVPNKKIFFRKGNTLECECAPVHHTHQLCISVLQTEVLMAPPPILLCQLAFFSLPAAASCGKKPASHRFFLPHPDQERLIKDDLFHFSEK